MLINGGFKYFINVFRGVLAERMLRRLRFQLVNRVLRFPLPHFKNISHGEVVSMVTAEAEPVGGFVGDSLSLPAFQGGMLITALVFIIGSGIRDYREMKKKQSAPEQDSAT